MITIVITVADLKLRLFIIPANFREVLKDLTDLDTVEYTYMATPFGNYPMVIKSVK